MSEWIPPPLPEVERFFLQQPPLETALALLELSADEVRRARRLDEIGMPDPEMLLSEIGLIGRAVEQAIRHLRRIQEVKHEA